MTTDHEHSHARDDWADSRTDEALRRELDTLAGVGATASALEGALGAVRTRVRRRRTAKQAGIGATTLVVAAGLVLGGAALLPDAPQPLPGPATTPSSSPSPSDDATPRESEDTAAESQTAGTAEGYQPSWLDGANLICGMRFDDLPENAEGRRLELLGEPVLEDDTSADGTQTVQTWRAPTRLTVEDAEDAGRRVSAPTLLWQLGARVVDVGVDTTETGMDQVADAPAERDAEDSTLSTCDPEPTTQGSVTSDVYTRTLGAGEYQVRAFVQLWSPDFTDVELVLSDPVTIVLGEPDDETAENAGASGSEAAECSAAGLDLPAPNLKYLPDAVQAKATAMLDAALACDDEALIALADASVPEQNWGNQTPRELLELPGAEENDDLYTILARLLAGTRACPTEGFVTADDGSEPTSQVSWPVMSVGGCADYPSDWDAVVDAGAVTAEEATAMRAEGAYGYTGWRLVLDGEDATWGQFVTGSWEDIAAGG